MNPTISTRSREAPVHESLFLSEQREHDYETTKSKLSTRIFFLYLGRTPVLCNFMTRGDGHVDPNKFSRGSEEVKKKLQRVGRSFQFFVS